MKRSEFLKICSILGIGLPFQSAFSSCKGDETEARFTGSVLIIGAGAGGLSSGYLLDQQGIEYKILEASSNYGGRMKRTENFADFPIPLGAEWIHADSSIFEEILNDPSIQVNVETVSYNSNDDYGYWEDGELEMSKLGPVEDLKFVNSTWFDFFDQYIVPTVSQNISYNKVVQSIDYSSDQVTVTTSDGETHSADRVIVSVPLKVLQDGDIVFKPDLPAYKTVAINDVTVWEGFKAFIEFSDKFYPPITEFDITPTSDGQQLYYDAGYGQQSSKNILGLFAVGSAARKYIFLEEDELLNFMLVELDTIFSGQATPGYIKHIAQNWSNEPFIKGAYVFDDENWRTVRVLGDSVDKVLFAGDAYTDGEDWGNVHTAAQSARVAVEELMRS